MALLRIEWGQPPPLGPQKVQLPVLLVPNEQDEIQEKRSIYDILRKRVLSLQVKLPYNLRCCGSSHGSLFFSTTTNFIIYNPFKEMTIKLPPVTVDLEEIEPVDPELRSSYFVKRAISSCDPFSHNDFEILIVYELDELAIFKAGDEKWSDIPSSLSFSTHDLFYYRGVFYKVDQLRGLEKVMMICGNGERNGNTRSYCLENVVPVSSVELFNEIDGCFYNYLAESSNGDLICATRILNEVENDGDEANSVEKKKITTSFQLFRLDVHAHNWVEVDTLGGDSLCLGDNQTICFNTAIDGYQRNSIYYTDDRGFWYGGPFYQPYGPCDLGIFNSENKKCSTVSFYQMRTVDLDMPPAVWILPEI